MKTLFFVIVAILQVIIALLPSLGKLYIEDPEDKSFNITSIGITFTVFVIICLGFTIGLYFISENEDQNNKDFLQQQQEKRDSIIANGITKGVDSNRKALFKDLSIALADQKLKLDTVTKSIKSLKDSTKGITNNYAQNDPILNIEENGITCKTDEYQNHKFVLTLKSYDAGSTNFDINFSVIVTPNIGPNLYAGLVNPISENSQISKDGAINFDLDLSISKELLKTYFWVRGDYTTIDGSKKLKVNSIYQFDHITKKTTQVSDTKIKKALLSIVPLKEVK